MDFMGRLELRNGVPAVTRSFGVREGNDIAPGWTVEAVAAPGVTTVDALVPITDDDDALCGSGDVEVDVNPSPNDRQVRLRLDLATGCLRLLDANLVETGVDVGFAGRPQQLQGTNGDETGIIDLTVAVALR